jgi:hypothetical protein
VIERYSGTEIARLNAARNIDAGLNGDERRVAAYHTDSTDDLAANNAALIM